jgi:predicted amino acid-binding ACT domain protein
VAYSRTNSLHEKLSPEVRKQVEADLIEQPPGRETYAKVWEYYSLGELGISKTALGRYGGFLRAMARNEWIGEVADHIVGDDISGKIAGVIRARLFEAVTVKETKIGDLMKAAISVKTLTDADSKQASLDEFRRKLETAAKQAQQEHKDPQRAMQEVLDTFDSMFGVGQSAKKAS